MGKMNYYGGPFLPADDQMEYYEDTHGGGAGQRVSGTQFGLNGSIVMYSPHTPDDVEMIINYLKTRQFAIIQLTGENPGKAQRILDMLSGAVFALGGSMAVVNREQNVYLLTPEGVSINVPISKR